MGRFAQLWMIFSLAIGLVGCQTFDVRTDWDAETSFDVFQQYFWTEPPEVEGANPFADNTLLRKRVRSTIEAELAERGFRSTDTRGDADFLVTYSVILEERLRVDGYTTTGGVYRSGYAGFGQIYASSNIRNFQESTLIIDFLDSNNDDLLWRGWAVGIVRTRDRDRGRGRLQKGVEAILQAFPPPAQEMTTSEPG
jgi:hypothetical protein